MTRKTLLLAPVFLALLAATAMQSTAAGQPSLKEAPSAATRMHDRDAIALATTLLDHLDGGRFTQAEALFSPAMRAAVPAEKLQQVWASLAPSVGPAGPRGTATASAQGDITVVVVPLAFARANLIARITLDVNREIAGFLVQPAPPPAPAPDSAASYFERDATVGQGERALAGTLTLPKAASAGTPVPGIVLVHGSGPHDRDETIGPNKPFLDIAHGLAAHGIAVLRYDKRTKARPQDAGMDFTVDAETTDDAVLAVDALRQTEGVDPAHVFVLGHSQGGLMAPRIAARSGQVAGLVLLAAPSRPLLDIVIEQNERLATMDDGQVSDAERKAIDAVIEQVNQVREPATAPAAKVLMGMPTGYWRSIDGVDPIAEARALSVPMLLQQGGRDFQVVQADWQRWQQAFDKHTRVTFKQYQHLNHLGIAGTGPGKPGEYAVAGHVDAGLIDDIADWIHQR